MVAVVRPAQAKSTGGAYGQVQYGYRWYLCKKEVLALGIWDLVSGVQRAERSLRVVQQREEKRREEQGQFG